MPKRRYFAARINLCIQLRATDVASLSLSEAATTNSGQADPPCSATAIQASSQQPQVLVPKAGGIISCGREYGVKRAVPRQLLAVEMFSMVRHASSLS
jgi:hypothetical protein